MPGQAGGLASLRAVTLHRQHQLGLCASCHQRRTLVEAAFIAEEVCADVPHRHLVFTVPRLIRGRFRTHHRWLGELALAARDAISAWLRDRTACPSGQPGLIVAVQTFGDFLLWHPHVHVLATAGVFTQDGAFQLAPTGGWTELRELWRHAVLRRLNQAGALADWQTEHLLSWRHGGFSLDAGEAPLAATDRPGRRRLAEYLLRAPFSLEKITCNSAAGQVLYRSERHWRTKRNFEVFRAHDFIAALVDQIPDKGVPSVRYYGWYSNKSRGLRRRTAEPVAAELPTATEVPPSPLPRRRRVRWRELIQQVWGADPLRCPLCPGLLRPIEWIETPADIRAFLEPLGLFEQTTGPPTQAPPPTDSDNDGAVLIEAESGEIYPAGPRPEPRRLAQSRSKTDPLYHRQWMLAHSTEDPDDAWQPDAEDDFDQTGFELPPWREATCDPRQGSLFPDYACQSSPPDGEPVFALTGRPADPADDFIQPDAPDSFGA